MFSNPPSLTDQLAARLKLFANNVGLTQKELARLLELDQGQLSRFLDGKPGVSSEMALRILRLTSLTKQQLDLKFGEKISSKILYLQEQGRPMTLSNEGWLAGAGPDPNDGAITGVKTATDLGNSDDYQAKISAFLKQQQEIYRQAIGHIDNYLANVQKAKVNKSGSTESQRKVNTNDKSSHPGSRKDLVDTPAKMKEQLEFVRRERKKSEEQLELQAELDRERKLYWNARVKTLRRQDRQ